MPFYVNASNSYKISNVFTKIDNTFKEAKQIYIKIGDTFKPIWSYTWKTGSWSECSVPCGGGTQTRTVECLRNDNIIKDDKFCSEIGSKPITSQNCNTQACYATVTYLDDCSNPSCPGYSCPEWGSGWCANYYQVYITNPGAGTNCYLSIQASYKSRRDTGDGTIGFRNLHDSYYNEIRSEGIKYIINYDNSGDTSIANMGGYRNDDFSFDCYSGKGSWRGGVYIPKFYVGTVPENAKTVEFAIYQARRGHDHGTCVTIKNCFVE